MISTSEYFDVMALDARRWPDHTDYYRHGPTRCAHKVPLVLRIDGPVARIIRLGFQSTRLTVEAR